MKRGAGAAEAVEALRATDDARRLLDAGLALVRLAPGGPLDRERELAWIARVLDEDGAIPPPGAVADLGWLAAGEPMRYGAAVRADAELARAIRVYEDELLGRLAADPHLDDAVAAIARLPAAQVERAVATFVAGVVRHIGFTAGVGLGTGAVRRLRADRSATEPVSGGPDVTPLLTAGYRGLARGARATARLVPPGLVFALEHFTALGSASLRLACDQVVRAASALEMALPARASGRPRGDASVATEAEIEGGFPAGGFAELTTQGGLENLVPSELAYIEPDHAAGIDWFDVRYVGGELLYFARDEGIHTRPRRVIAFAFLPDLVRARVLDSGLGAQRLLLALALVLAVSNRLARWLSVQALSIECWWIVPPDTDPPLAQERRLIEVLLAPLVNQGVCTSLELESLDAARALVVERARAGTADLVVLGHAAPPPAPAAPSARAIEHAVALADAVPRWRDGPAPPPSPDPFDAWREAARALASALA